MNENELDRDITLEDAARFQEAWGELPICYSCGDPITVGAWITMRPNTAYSWCAECLKPE